MNTALIIVGCLAAYGALLFFAYALARAAGRPSPPPSFKPYDAGAAAGHVGADQILAATPHKRGR